MLSFIFCKHEMITMGPRNNHPGKFLLLAFVLLSVTPGMVQADTVTVANAWELHAALASPSITLIYLTRNITLTADTCPFPSHSYVTSTFITRNVTIASLPLQQPQEAAAAGSWPYWLNCGYFSDRFTLRSHYQLTIRNLVAENCRTFSPAGCIKKERDAVVRLENLVEVFGSICLPPEMQAEGLSKSPRTPKAPPPAIATANGQQQVVTLSTSYDSANWCRAASQLDNTSNSSSRGFVFHSNIPPTADMAICQYPAIFVADAAIEFQAFNTSDGTGPGDPYTFEVVNTTVICPDPVSKECVTTKGPDTCLAAVYDKLNPDNNIPCTATDGFSFHQAFVNPNCSKIVLLQSAEMNLTTCPSNELPAPLTRNITILSDPRGPRLTWDCSSLSDRVQLMPGHSLTLQHIILANCSTPKPVSIVRFSNNTELIVNDTFIVPAANLCLPVMEQLGDTLHQSRPESIAGVQSMAPGQPESWCRNDSGVDNTKTPGSIVSTNSYTQMSVPIAAVKLFANTTGWGPAYAATLSDPAVTPYYVHPTWPAESLCKQKAAMLVDVATSDPHGWIDDAAQNDNTAEQPGLGSYNGTFTVRYINSAWLCPQPLAVADCSNMEDPEGCLAAAYDRANPDNMLLPGAAAYRVQQEQAHKTYGVRVILPAVLASVVPVLLLAAAIGALYVRARRHHAAEQSALLAEAKARELEGWPSSSGTNGTGGSRTDIASTPPPGLWTWLRGGGQSHASSLASSDPARRLLGISNRGSARSGGTASSHLASSPDGIALNVLLGAGSFGRVYAGTWQGRPVAVKIITHSSADDDRIKQELALSLSFDHPNLVRALHYTKMKINPDNATESLGAPSTLGSTDLFLPDGAVGVFTLPSTWAIIQRGTTAQPAPTIDTETWIVMDLMDRGNLAASLRHSKLFVNEETGAVDMGRVLRRAADVAAGISYLHSRNVCHGDLKCENCLLKAESQDPDGLLAKVADFGLSRALAFGQSHLSTRRYGTVTHMPPELLVAGKLTPAADVYSFGIMMWEFVTRELPFAGLHHGEVIHKVVTQDLRPGPWPRNPEQAGLHPGYIPLAEACWARGAEDRPSMALVLQRLLEMLAEVEGLEGSVDWV